MFLQVSILIFYALINFVSGFHLNIDEHKPPSLKVSKLKYDNYNSLAIGSYNKNAYLHTPIKSNIHKSSFVCGCQPNNYSCGQENMFNVSDFHTYPESPKKGETITFNVTGTMSENITFSDFPASRFTISNASGVSVTPILYDRFDFLCDFLEMATTARCGKNSSITTKESQKTTIISRISVLDELPNGVYDFSFVAFTNTYRNPKIITCLTSRINFKGN